jgi:hypothetical protein
MIVAGRHAGEAAFLRHRSLSDAQRKKLTEAEQGARCMQRTLLHDAATATTTTSSFWLNIQVCMDSTCLKCTAPKQPCRLL